MKNIFSNHSNNLPEEGIKIVSHCPVCHLQYNPVEAKILGEIDNAHLIYIKCQNCSAAVLALISTNHFGISSIGLLTDLDGSEVLNIKNREAVDASDVLDVWQSNYLGKIRELIN